MGSRTPAGYSLIELVVVAAVVAAVSASSMPVLLHAADAADAVAAARHLAALVARARFEAARRNRTVALRLDDAGGEASYTLVVDGDGDGVGVADVAAGIDSPLGPPDRLSAHFTARFAIAGAVPEIDGGGLLTSLDPPIRLGAASQISLTPLGTASSGTLYIASGRGRQFAVRIAGVTGRVRVLRYVPGESRWQPM